MNILFFCGSLELGRDGVGDYTRRLAGECAARGHACLVLALHDCHVPRPSDLTVDNVRFVRLPAADPWPERIACALQHLQRFAPAAVSWQFVAYGLHPRGFLPAALLRSAPDLRGPRCHVMLHELWIGLELGSGWRARAIGWLQRRGVVCLLDQLDPDCVHTSNPTYQRALGREGCAAGVLGLFGNVPVESDFSVSTDSLARRLPAPPTPDGAAPLVAVTFGTLHPQWSPTATAAWLRATALRLGRSPTLVAIGRGGAHAPAILNQFRQQGVAVVETGDLPGASVSHLLRAADFGIAPHPWALIGKSGAAAAMLEHGLPVLVPRDDWRLRGSPGVARVASDPLLTRLAGLDEIRTDRWLATRRAPQSALPRTADSFLAALSLSS
ncbi:MAG: hypothetical protein H7343_00440 [Undibacterium sp.]|nr:hypothetical protein [Opitutaceae bacterium]